MLIILDYGPSLWVRVEIKAGRWSAHSQEQRVKLNALMPGVQRIVSILIHSMTKTEGMVPPTVHWAFPYLLRESRPFHSHFDLDSPPLRASSQEILDMPN